jgi:methyl-accepting chemotaxis protein
VGDDYTGLLPLCDSNGERYAALCVDVEISSIHEELDSSTRRMVATVLLLGVLFDVLLLLWVRRSVTTPIALLERSVVSYAAQCRDQKDPEALKLEVPEIHTQNEIETLSHAFIQMSEAMQNYVRSTARAESALAKMEVLANKDSLTSVRNKTAFDALPRTSSPGCSPERRNLPCWWQT